MTDRAFVIMQVGGKDSPERKRADEIYNYVINPPVIAAGLEPYRADLDPAPGAITHTMLSELLSARVVIADLTGRNPNVFYELGITHSFVRPLISIVDLAPSLPFDAKDERVIELGEYSGQGLGYAQGQLAQEALAASLKIVLGEHYDPPSPLREVAASRSVEALAPENPLAAEMAQIREILEEIRKNPGQGSSEALQQDIEVLRKIVEATIGYLEPAEVDYLTSGLKTSEQLEWAAKLERRWRSRKRDARAVLGLDDSEVSDEPSF